MHRAAAAGAAAALPPLLLLCDTQHLPKHAHTHSHTHIHNCAPPQPAAHGQGRVARARRLRVAARLPRQRGARAPHTDPPCAPPARRPSACATAPQPHDWARPAGGAPSSAHVQTVCIHALLCAAQSDAASGRQLLENYLGRIHDAGHQVLMRLVKAKVRRGGAARKPPGPGPPCGSAHCSVRACRPLCGAPCRTAAAASCPPRAAPRAPAAVRGRAHAVRARGGDGLARGARGRQRGAPRRRRDGRAALGRAGCGAAPLRWARACAARVRG